MGGSARLAALHRQGEAWRLVVAELRPNLRVLEARTVSGDMGEAVRAAAALHRFDRVVRIVPGRSTVARAVAVPDAAPAELAGAVALLAEAQLPEAFPAHRRAAGVIPDQPRAGMRTALVTGWQPEVVVEAALVAEGIAETWTTEIAALAMLRGVSPLGAYIDPSDGSIAILAGGPERTGARVLVEEAARLASIAPSIVAESCAALGVEAATVRVRPAGATLHLDDRSIAALRARVGGVPAVTGWLDEHGIALGAILVGSGDDPLTRPLGELRATAPLGRRPAARRMAAWVGVPRHAWGIAAASLALLVLAPLALSYARLSVLNAKVGNVVERRAERDLAVLRRAMDDQLAQSRWPMSKLLADLAGVTPVGIVVDTLRVSSDQRDVVLQGQAEKAELVNAFQAKLMATRIFGEVKVNRVEASGAGVSFDVAAKVQSPYIQAAGAEDFRTQTLAVRLYGENASNTTPPVRSASAGSGPREPGRSARSSEDSGPRPSGRPSAESPGRPSPSASGQLPPPLTDEQIKAMDRATATREWVGRRSYAQQHPELDPGEKARLEDEVRRLQEHTRSAGGGP